jgi:FkbM family methyltransferase
MINESMLNIYEIGSPKEVREINRFSILVLEITRFILSQIKIRGRYRIGSIISRIAAPKGKVGLNHRFGSKMVFDFTNKHEISMYYDLFAPNLTLIMKNILGPGDCFVDCGANIGYFSSIASSLVGPTGKVISIDANPYCIHRIYESKYIGCMENMDIISCAIGGRNGQIEFNIANDPMYSSIVDINKLQFTKTESTIHVPLLTLDDILRNRINKHERVRLLKLDIEGAEIDALHGAIESIGTDTLEYIYIEIHEHQIHLRGQCPEEIYGLLSSRGFTCDKRWAPNAMLFKSPN